MQPFDMKDIPAWVNWIACDADGTWWGFLQEPLENDHGWYENEIGRYVRLGKGERCPDWKETLRRVR